VYVGMDCSPGRRRLRLLSAAAGRYCAGCRTGLTCFAAAGSANCSGAA
jgi:hypothetical protein